MGLLNSNTLNDYITKTIPANARSMWQGVKRIPQDLRQLTDPAFMQGLLSQPRNPLDPNEMAAMGMDYVQPMGGLLAHTVYHGSPHKFDKFDMSKIGTGEGAQAYGHGLYMAESPEVAKAYSKMTPINSRIDIENGAFIQKSDMLNNLRGISNSRMLNILKIKHGERSNEYLTALKDKAIKDMDFYIGESKAPARLIAIQQDIKNASIDDISSMVNGNLYKVDIPDESIPRMLDWDKPLSEQTTEVQNAINLLGLSKEEAMFAPNTWKIEWDDRLRGYGAAPQMGGLVPLDTADKAEAAKKMNELANDWYKKRGVGVVDELVKKLGGPDKAAEALKHQGIPGIRYLDQASRGSGEGTSNFVLFDDQLPRILEINGQPTGLLSYADEAKKAKKDGT